MAVKAKMLISVLGMMYQSEWKKAVQSCIVNEELTCTIEGMKAFNKMKTNVQEIKFCI